MQELEAETCRLTQQVAAYEQEKQHLTQQVSESEEQVVALRQQAERIQVHEQAAAKAFEGGVGQLEAEVECLLTGTGTLAAHLAKTQQRLADSLAQSQRLEAAWHQSHAQLAAVAQLSVGIVRDLKAELQASVLAFGEQIAGSEELVGEVEAEVAQVIMQQRRQGEEDARALEQALAAASSSEAGMHELRVHVAALQQQALEDRRRLDAAHDQARLAGARVQTLDAEVQRLEQEAAGVAGKLVASHTLAQAS